MLFVQLLCFTDCTIRSGHKYRKVILYLKYILLVAVFQQYHNIMSTRSFTVRGAVGLG
jgi:hypothetical protein